MARKRIIDPDFWIDDTLAGLTIESRLFYIGIWNFSDDYGVIENNPVKLKAQIFPYDDIKIEPLVEELVRSHRLLPYQSESKNWLYVKNFLKWQKVEKPSQKRNPPYTVGEESPTSRGGVVSEVKLSEVKLSEVKRESGAIAPTPKDRSLEFFTKPEIQEVVKSRLVERGVPENVATQELKKFISYWTELNGTGSKQRWEMEKTFDINGRLGRWFANIKDFKTNSSSLTNAIRI